MTKSRTLRKAAAVALSLAMAFSVATVSTDASAAAKPALKASKVTVKVKKSVKVGIKNAKLLKKLTVKSKNKKVAKAAAVGKKAVKITGVAAGKTKVLVTMKYKSGEKTETLKKNITIKVAKAKTDDDGKVVTQSLKLVDIDGLQSDGTAAIGDRLQVKITGQTGSIQAIYWYLNGSLESTPGLINSSSYFIPQQAGEVQARAVTTGGTTYESDKLMVSAKEALATVSGAGVEDDYEDKIIDFQKNDTQGIVEFTLSKDFSGKFQIYAEKDGKATGDMLAEFATSRVTYNEDGSVAGGTDYDKTAYSKHALYVKTVGSAAAAGTKAGNNSTTSYKTKNDDGSVTWHFILNGEIVAGKSIDRGSSYIAVFDQNGVIDDDVKATSPNYSNAFTIPYVTAPAKLTLNAISTAEKVSAKFVDAEGKTTEWMFGGDTTTLAAVGLSSIDIWNYTDNTVNTTKGTKIAAPTTQSITKGVYKSNAVGDDTKKWYIAEAKTVKEVFAKDAVTLTSEIASLAPAVGEITSVGPKADDAKTTDNEAKIAEVKFKNLLADSDVFLVKGDATEAASVKVTKFDASNDKTYAKKVEVTKGAASVDIPDAFPDGVAVDATGANAGNANTFAVIVIPKDQSTYSRVDKIDDANQKLTQSIAKFELAGSTTTATTAGGLDVQLVAKDQYGKNVIYTATTTFGGASTTISDSDQKDSLPAPADKNYDVTIGFSNYTCASTNYQGGALTVSLDESTPAEYKKNSTWTTGALSTGQKIRVTIDTAGDENNAKVKVSIVEKA